MATLTDADIAALAIHARMGSTLDQALAELPATVKRSTAQRVLANRGVSFRRAKQPLRSGQWVAAACRDAMPDDMDARQSNRERARVRYRVRMMKMSMEEAVKVPIMTAAEKGRLGALKRWGAPEVVEEGSQLTWRWCK